MMKMFTTTYWLFWLGILPIVYWRGSPDYEFPKFIGLLIGVNIWGIVYILITKKNFLELNNQIDKLIIATGLIATIGWVVNGFRINGLIGEEYRYQGLVTIWTMIEWYLLSRKLFVDDQKWFGVIQGSGLTLVVLALFFPLMGNPNFIAAYLVLLSTIKPEMILKIGSGIIAWVTDSRSAALAWFASLLLNVKKKWLIAGMIVLGVILIIVFPKKLTSSFDNRLIIWEKSAQLVAKKPIFGWGPENFDTAFGSVLTASDFDLKNVRVDRAHNIILDILANTGLVGLLIWITLFYWLFKSGRRQENIFLIAFLIISGLNVININTWLLFYMMAARISQSCG
jgi:O-antigen ligase